MTDELKTLRDALDAGPTSALYTHPRDDNKWKENEALALACTPELLNALLARLDAAEADARRYRWLRKQNNDDLSFAVVKSPHFDVFESAEELDSAIDTALKGA